MATRKKPRATFDDTLLAERQAYLDEFSAFVDSLKSCGGQWTKDEKAEYERREQEWRVYNAAFIDACRRYLPHIPWPPPATEE